MNSTETGNKTGKIGQEARENMGQSKNKMGRLRKLAMLCFAALAACVMLIPASANAVKIANPSPPDFYGELTGGFLQLSGAGGTKIFQLSLDFEELGLSRPSFRGTVDSSGNIFVPQSQLVFPPLSFDIPPDTVNLTLLPTAPATGKIDPLTGRVDFRIKLRIQGTGSASGVSLGGSCFVGNASNPIDIDGHTHQGTFPAATALYQASFLPDNAGFLGGIQEGQAYSDEAGVWPEGPTPPGGVPVPADVPRAAGSFRIGNDTLQAIAASGCGPLGLANGPLNDQVGLPSDPGGSTAILDFAFVVGGSRTGTNALVQKGVKSNFTAPGVSSVTWPSTEIPDLPTTVPATIDASASTFAGTPNAGGRYSFDLGTGSYGAFTNTAVQPISFATPGLRTIRVRTRDADGDIDTKTRQINVVPSTDIAVTNSVVGGEVRGGSNGTIRMNVTNTTATRSNTQPIVLITNLPAGTSFNSTSAPAGWVCGFSSPTVTCTLPTGSLAGGATSVVDVNFAVSAGANNPLSSTATVTQSGDPSTANDTSTISIPVRKTDASIAISHSGSVVANGTVSFDVAVANAGDAPTVGSTVVSVTLPPLVNYRNAGSGGTGWSCVSGPTQQDVTCTRTAVIAAGASAPALTVNGRVDRTANGTITANAAVSTQGDTDAFGGSNTASDDVSVLVVPDVALQSTVTGDYTVGSPGQVTFSATNESVLSINGPTTITSTLPAGLTVSSMTGSGWDCTATTPGTGDISCDYAASLAAAETAPDLIANLAVGHDAYPSVTIDSAVANTEDGFAGNDTASSTTGVRRIDVNMNKSAVRSFSVGIDGQYRLSVSNIGDAATVGQIKVLDELPSELKLKSVSGGGWNCAASVVGQQHVECVLNSTVAPASAAAVINVKVDVLDAAADAGEVSNTATVDTTRDDRAVPGDSPVTGNNTSTAVTKAVSVDLSVESTHGPTFVTGRTESYSLKVRNVGTFPTVPGENVTVVDVLPAGMVPQTADIFKDRPGWTCTDLNTGTVAAPQYTVTCVLTPPDGVTSALLAGQTATLDIPVYIGDTATASSVNGVEISTLKDASVEKSPNNRSEDPTTVTRIDLATSANASIPPRAGGIGEITVGVINNGSAATADPTVVTIPLASGVSYRPTGSTTAGWTCSSPGAATQVTCTRTPSIAAGGSAPPLKVRTNVAASAPASWNTLVTVRTAGEVAARLGDNDVTVSQSLEKIDLAMHKSHVVGSIKSGAHGEYQLSVENIGNTASTGTSTVTETVSSEFASPQGSGTGWSCSTAGQNLTCTRTAPIAPGATTPTITVGFDVDPDAAGTRNTIATVTNSSDPYPANNSVNDPITIVATADIAVSIDQPGAMRVGEVSTIEYQVRNVGTDSTSGDPSVHLKVTMPENLEPVDTDSADPWDCTQIPAAPGGNAYFVCDLSSELAPGDSSTLSADVRPLPSSETETGSLARITSAGDINQTNDVALATSNLSGIDLGISVAPKTSPADDDFQADVKKNREITVENVGTSATTGTTRVKVPLPDGITWAAIPPYGTGWTCNQPVRTIICQTDTAIPAGTTAPKITLGLKASRSNAPEVQISYLVEALNDENAGNDTATRTDTVLYVPETTITSAPSGTTESRSASIVFESDDGAATFDCKVDGGAAAPCTSPLSLTGLALGGHSVSITAKNPVGMVDASPAEANWTIIPPPAGGTKVANIKADLTEGSLSLAALGEVPLPPDQLSLVGDLYDNGAWSVPKEGVTFKPIEQTIPDALGPGQNVTVKISITATGPGSGKLTNGGGDAAFNLPVQAKLEASLGTIPVIGPEADCYLRPISFDLNGTYDEAAKKVTVGSSSVGFPTVSAGCGALGGTVNGLIGLPRNDIDISMTFSLVKTAIVDPVCVAPQTGTPPNCVNPPPVAGKPHLTMLKTIGKKSVKSGKKLTLTARVKNDGDGDATDAKVCLTGKPKKLVNSSFVCKRIKAIVAGTTSKVKFPVKTKPGNAGKKIKFTFDTSYTPEAGAAKTHTKTGHVTLMK